MAVIFLVPLVIGMLVAMDARARYGKGFSWGLGVFLVLIVMLPVYLIHRARTPSTVGAQAAVHSVSGAGPLMSLDGQFYWNGSQWTPITTPTLYSGGQ